MVKYAQDTAVSSDQSRQEIERTLTRYGASAFGYGWQEGSAVIVFEAKGRRIKFTLPMPDKKDKSFHFTPSRGLKRSSQEAAAQYEQAVRQKWRALALAIKAKLEAVEAGITEFEDEFLSQIVMPNGQSIGDWMKPQIAIAYKGGKMPPMLGYSDAVEGAEP